MEHYKTIPIGVSNGNVARHVSEIVLLDNQTVASYSDLVSILSNTFWKAGFQYQQKIRNHAHGVKLLIPDVQKEGFWLDSLKTIEWFLDNMVPPPGGIVFDLYFYKNLFPGINNPISMQTIWPLKKRWIGDGDYVTVQKISPGAAGRKTKTAKEIGHYNLIQNIEKYCPYPVKEFSYKDGEEKSCELLIHSKRHFTYDGGAYSVAGMVDVPTVCYGFPFIPTYSESSIYDMKADRLRPSADRKRIKYEKSTWLATPLGPTARVYHLDIKSNLCIQKPQTYIRHAWDKEELLGYITFTKDLEIVNRDRKDWVDLNDLPDWPV